MKRPSFQFYPGDWLRDTALRSLSYHDRGIWIELLCLMHDLSERGVLVLNGKPMSEEVIARMIGLDKQTTSTSISSLIESGVIKVRESDGALYSKRMVEDEKLTEIRRNAGKQGGNPALLKQNKTSQLKQIETPSSSSSSSSSNALKKKLKKESEPIPIPLLLNTPEFIEHWESFLQMRKEIKKPMFDTAKSRNLKKLEEMGLQRAIAALEFSTMRQYQGIFEPPSEQRNPMQSQSHAASSSQPTMEELLRGYNIG